MTWKENNLRKLDEANKRLGKRSSPNIIWLDELEDDSKLRFPSWNLEDGIPTIASALNDFEKGLICFAGKPNHGKSTILVNMITQSLDLNKDFMVLDISLDDPYDKRFQQYVASLTGLYYQEITTSAELTPGKENLKSVAIDKIKGWYEKDLLRTIEAIEPGTTEEIAGEPVNSKRYYRDPEEIFRLLRKTREEYPERKIAVFIDAWNNLNLTGASKLAGNELSQANYYLAKFQEVANQLDIMIILSAHLRKSEHKKKSTLDDIKGTSDMSYNAVWAGIVNNELKDRALKSPLSIVINGKEYPIVVIDIVKTKVSGWEMPLMYVLKSAQCTLEPLERHQYEQYLKKYLGYRS